MTITKDAGDIICMSGSKINISCGLSRTPNMPLAIDIERTIAVRQHRKCVNTLH